MLPSVVGAQYNAPCGRMPHQQLENDFKRGAMRRSLTTMVQLIDASLSCALQVRQRLAGEREGSPGGPAGGGPPAGRWHSSAAILLL